MQPVSPGISVATHPFCRLLQTETKSSGWKIFILKARSDDMPLDCGVVQKFREESFLVSLAAVSCSSINWKKAFALLQNKAPQKIQIKAERGRLEMAGPCFPSKLMFWYICLWDWHSLSKQESNNHICFMIPSMPRQHKSQHIHMALIVKDNNHLTMKFSNTSVTI